MSLGKQMTERLGVLAKQGSEAAQLQPLSNEPQTWQLLLDHANQHARLELFDFDRYSVTLCALEVGGYTHLQHADAHTTLTSRASEIARQLSYLEEPLALWELDGQEEVVQLRSTPPRNDNQEVSYWEVTLCLEPEPRAKLVRYRWTPDMTDREVVAYPATFAILERITDSLHAALSSNDM